MTSSSSAIHLFLEAQQECTQQGPMKTKTNFTHAMQITQMYRATVH